MIEVKWDREAVAPIANWFRRIAKNAKRLAKSKSGPLVKRQKPGAGGNVGEAFARRRLTEAEASLAQALGKSGRAGSGALDEVLRD